MRGRHRREHAGEAPRRGLAAVGEPAACCVLGRLGNRDVDWRRHEVDCRRRRRLIQIECADQSVDMAALDCDQRCDALARRRVPARQLAIDGERRLLARQGAEGDVAVRGCGDRCREAARSDRSRRRRRASCRCRLARRTSGHARGGHCRSPAKQCPAGDPAPNSHACDRTRDVRVARRGNVRAGGFGATSGRRRCPSLE
jgi:hypothetical protein